MISKNLTGKDINKNMVTFIGLTVFSRQKAISPNRYKLSKQADVLMLFYLLSADELDQLFKRLGYPLAL